MLNVNINRDIITFIPPWNAVNGSIHDALVRNGFRVLSGELYEPAVPTQYPLNYYPETLGDMMRIKGTWRAAEECIFGWNEHHAVCVVMFHAYDLPEKEAWDCLEELLDRCKADCNVELYTFASLLESGETADGMRYNANLLSSGLKKLVMPNGVMCTTWLCYLVHGANAALHALIWILACMVLLYDNKCKNKWYKIAPVIGIAIVILSLSWLQVLGPLKLLAVTLLVSVIPLLIKIMKKECK